MHLSKQYQLFMKRKLLTLTAILAMSGWFTLNAQEFDFELPDEFEDEPADVVIVEDKAQVDGFFSRLLKFMNGARAESATDDQDADPWRAGTVSTDPDDPEQKPQGTILFSLNW